jgi:antitoxin (DNA-binding transcriptional repressor) of toxin-antitoxin stability system
MKIFVEVSEASERLEELIDLARRGDTVLICRQAKPVAELSTIPKPPGTWDDIRGLAAEGRGNVPSGTTSNHDDFYDDHGLPK